MLALPCVHTRTRIVVSQVCPSVRRPSGHWRAGGRPIIESTINCGKFLPISKNSLALVQQATQQNRVICNKSLTDSSSSFIFYMQTLSPHSTSCCQLPPPSKNSTVMKHTYGNLHHSWSPNSPSEKSVSFASVRSSTLGSIACAFVGSTVTPALVAPPR